MVDRPRVLFLCTANSCRSQLAEAWLRHLVAGRVEALSAGTAPTRVHPWTLRVLGEVGLEVRSLRSKSIHEFLEAPPDLVIAVCDDARRSCPPFPRPVPTLQWTFPDPAQVVGEPDEVARAFRAVRDAIRERLEDWIETGLEPLSAAPDGSRTA